MENIKKLIGNTPLIKINYKYKGKVNYIYTKLEYYNLTGSIKDRVIYYILNKAIMNKKLNKDMPLVEATSGNTGISLSAIGAYLNHPVYIFMPDWVSVERIKIMQLYGANVKLVSKEEGGFQKCIELARNFAQDNNGFLTNQFINVDNINAHYESTGKEIINKIKVDAFISGIGTGGTLMGISKRLKEENINTMIYALEPSTMSLLKNNTVGSHKIEGIGDDFIPEIVDKGVINDIILIDDIDALNMSKKLALQLGIGVGISSGANMLGAIMLKELGYNNVVTVFPDDLKKYLSTDLCKNIEKSNYDDIELISYEVI